MPIVAKMFMQTHIMKFQLKDFDDAGAASTFSLKKGADSRSPSILVPWEDESRSKEWRIGDDMMAELSSENLLGELGTIFTVGKFVGSVRRRKE